MPPLKKKFAAVLLDWFRENRRDLPWRSTRDPYRIWVSEVILQQTRVDQGLPYYHAFLEKFPTVNDLARASEVKVLRTWQGLGYYSRARNMHRCARTVAEIHGGRFPETVDGLLELPGIGAYTAAAVASICFNAPAAVVDGNVFRVLSRIFGIDTPINSPAGRTEFTLLANSLLPETGTGEYNQAVMEFGALHCTPRNPACDECPFRSACVARAGGLQAQLPVKLASKPRKTRHLYYLVLRTAGKIAMRKRVAGDIWEGLYDFPLVESDKPLTAARLGKELSALAGFQVKPAAIATVKHQLTHQQLLAEFHLAEVPQKAVPPQGSAFYSPSQIGRLPKPVHILRFVEALSKGAAPDRSQRNS